MNGIYGISETDELVEMDESDEAYDGEFDEARGRRPAPRPVGTAGRGSAYQPRPSPAAVTQAQLQAALARVSQQINVNSAAIKTVDGRTRGITAEQGRLSTGLKKEFTDRKRDILAVRKDLQATREAGVLLPILGALAPNSPIAAFAPLLLLGNDVSADPNPQGGGAPATTTSGGLLGTGNSTTGLIMLLALSGSLGGANP